MCLLSTKYVLYRAYLFGKNLFKKIKCQRQNTEQSSEKRTVTNNLLQ